jgi:hypothetical protein
MPRRQPKTVLGGSIYRGPHGYRAIPQYTPVFPTPQTVKQIYSNATQRRYTPSWDGKDAGAHLTILFTEPIRIRTGCCFASLGLFVAYEARGEYGLFRHESKHRHPRENFPRDHFARQPNDAFEPQNPTFRIDGERGGRSSHASASFMCPKCGHEFRPRNLRRLGKQLWEDRPSRYELSAP